MVFALSIRILAIPQWQQNWYCPSFCAGREFTLERQAGFRSGRRCVDLVFARTTFCSLETNRYCVLRHSCCLRLHHWVCAGNRVSCNPKCCSMASFHHSSSHLVEFLISPFLFIFFLEDFLQNVPCNLDDVGVKLFAIGMST